MIEVSRAAYEATVDHAREGAPEEVCGVLAGEHGEGVSHVETAERATNVSGTPVTEYAIDPAEQFEVIEAIEDDGREVAGFYHSHPAGPFHPSGTDAARATWPGLSYVIVVLAAEYPYVGSWRWNGEDESFEQEAVRVVEG